MSKHTPGEWLRDGMTVYALNDHGSNRMVLNVQGGYRPSMDTPDAYERTSAEELEANAVLVAAAPKLADALRDVVYQRPGDAGAYGRAANLLQSLGLAEGR